MKPLRVKLLSLEVRHTHLNIRPDQDPDDIGAAVTDAFAGLPDTIGFNEATAVTHEAIRDLARQHGYGVYVPDGAANQLVICWRRSRFSLLLRRTRVTHPGRGGVTPHRYVARVRLVDKLTQLKVVVAVTHLISSGWTGATSTRDALRRLVPDAWRRARWQAHMAVMRRILRTAVKANDLVIWSGDMNRPAWSFSGRVFPRLRFTGTCSVVADTGPTHGGARFDYTGAISRVRQVRVTADTFDTRSDHRGIRARYTLTA